MKAAVVPSVNGKWEVKEWPTPKAGPNQVVIKIHASGLCYTDVHITHGMVPTQFPRVLGHEPVGEIVEVGPGVTGERRLRKMDHVRPEGLRLGHLPADPRTVRGDVG